MMPLLVGLKSQKCSGRPYERPLHMSNLTPLQDCQLVNSDPHWRSPSHYYVPPSTFEREPRSCFPKQEQ